MNGKTVPGWPKLCASFRTLIGIFSQSVGPNLVIWADPVQFSLFGAKSARMRSTGRQTCSHSFPHDPTPECQREFHRAFFLGGKRQNRFHRACTCKFCPRPKVAVVPDQFSHNATQNAPRAPKWPSEPMPRTSLNYCAEFLAATHSMGSWQPPI